MRTIILAVVTCAFYLFVGSARSPTAGASAIGVSEEHNARDSAEQISIESSRRQQDWFHCFSPVAG